jgi:hypothetical protein
MVFPIRKRILITIYCFTFMFLAGQFIIVKCCTPIPDTTSSSKSKKLKGYNAIVLFAEKFFAVGTDGRIDCISKNGGKIPLDTSCKNNLNCAVANEEILVVGGDNGTILNSTDGKVFYQCESVSSKNINGISYRNGLFVAGADNGTVLISKNGKSWNAIATKIKGNVLSISANSTFFIGVSDSGEIIKSINGVKWEIKDYNREYAGYNSYSKFRKILAIQNSIVIIGTHNDGSPSILFSSLGNVWAERTPVYHDEQGTINYLTKKPNGITYDSLMDEFILACDNGELFSLPSCSKCNKCIKISEINLNAIIYDNNCLFVVGDEFYLFVQRL